MTTNPNVCSANGGIDWREAVQMSDGTYLWGFTQALLWFLQLCLLQHGAGTRSLIQICTFSFPFDIVH